MNEPTEAIAPEQQTVSLRDLTTILIKHFGHHSGRFQVGVGYRVGVGGVNIGEAMPGVMVGVEGVILIRVPDGAQGLESIDAAEVNPAPAKKRAPRKKAV